MGDGEPDLATLAEEEPQAVRAVAGRVEHAETREWLLSHLASSEESHV